jgi:hypothetical protein
LAELREFAGAIRTREKRGLSRDERAELLERFQPIRRSIGWISDAGERLVTSQRGTEGFLDAIDTELAPGSLAQLTLDWVTTWSQDPDLQPEVDAQHLRSSWSERILSLLRRMDDITEKLERGGGLEVRLDEDVLAVCGWLRREFKDKTPLWKASGVGFKGLVGGGFLFRMLFFVDDIELEHFMRQSRVEGQVRREAHRRLREEGISLPVPRYQVTLQGTGLQVPTEPAG